MEKLLASHLKDAAADYGISARTYWETRRRLPSLPPEEEKRKRISFMKYQEEKQARESRRRVHPTGNLATRTMTMEIAGPAARESSKKVGEEEITNKKWLDEEANWRLHEEEELKIYTDGACYRNGKEDAKASIGVWINPEHPLNTSKVLPVKLRQSNNTAEILAAVEAVRIARLMHARRVCIRSDSNLLVQAWNGGVPFWQSNGWRTTSGKPVKNRKEFSSLIAEVAQTPGLVLRVEHVPGHSNCLGNVGADALATSAIVRYVEKTNRDRALHGLPLLDYTPSMWSEEKAGKRIQLSPLQRQLVEDSCRKVDLRMRIEEDELEKSRSETILPRREPSKACKLGKLLEPGTALQRDLRGKLEQKRKIREEILEKEKQKREAWKISQRKALEMSLRTSRKTPEPQGRYKASKIGTGVPYPSKY